MTQAESAAESEKPARMSTEEVIAAMFAERHSTVAPDLSGRGREDRQSALTEWADKVGALSPEGRVVLHHTGQTREEVLRRFQRMEARKARQTIAASPE